jgi:hypothetical protein
LTAGRGGRRLGRLGGEVGVSRRLAGCDFDVSRGGRCAGFRCENDEDGDDGQDEAGAKRAGAALRLVVLLRVVVAAGAALACWPRRGWRGARRVGSTRSEKWSASRCSTASAWLLDLGVELERGSVFDVDVVGWLTDVVECDGRFFHDLLPRFRRRAFHQVLAVRRGRKVQKLQIADCEDGGLASCCLSDVRRKVQKLKIGGSSRGCGPGGSGALSVPVGA